MLAEAGSEFQILAGVWSLDFFIVHISQGNRTIFLWGFGSLSERSFQLLTNGGGTGITLNVSNNGLSYQLSSLVAPLTFTLDPNMLTVYQYIRIVANAARLSVYHSNGLAGPAIRTATFAVPPQPFSPVTSPLTMFGTGSAGLAARMGAYRYFPNQLLNNPDDLSVDVPKIEVCSFVQRSTLKIGPVETRGDNAIPKLPVGML